MKKRIPINPGWSFAEKYTFSPAVRMGNLLFISGQVPVDDRGNLVGKGDMVAQCRQVYANIQKVLKAAGATFDHVVKTTDYVTTFENYKETAEVRREVFGRDFPAATGVLVRGLTGKDFLIEIEAIGVRLRELPMTAERVFAALSKREQPA